MDRGPSQGETGGAQQSCKSGKKASLSHFLQLIVHFLRIFVISHNLCHKSAIGKREKLGILHPMVIEKRGEMSQSCARYQRPRSQKSIASRGRKNRMYRCAVVRTTIGAEEPMPPLLALELLFDMMICLVICEKLD